MDLATNIAKASTNFLLNNYSNHLKTGAHSSFIRYGTFRSLPLVQKNIHMIFRTIKKDCIYIFRSLLEIHNIKTDTIILKLNAYIDKHEDALTTGIIKTYYKSTTPTLCTLISPRVTIKDICTHMIYDHVYERDSLFNMMIRYIRVYQEEEC